MQSKYELRKHFRALRRALPSQKRALAAAQCAETFSRLPAFISSQRIACYLPYESEMNSHPLIERIWSEKKKCYLPVLDKEEKTLIFARYRYGDALHENRFGILEPVNVEAINPERLDVVITPLVAFDILGHRLGTGGGYYDRSFAFLQSDVIAKPLIIGLGYSFQQADLLPADPWDILLDGVITEDGFVNCD